MKNGNKHIKKKKKKKDEVGSARYWSSLRGGRLVRMLVGSYQPKSADLRFTLYFRVHVFVSIMTLGYDARVCKELTTNHLE